MTRLTQILKEMKIVNVLSHIDPSFGGIGGSVAKFCSVPSGIFREQIVAFCDNAEQSEQDAEITRFQSATQTIFRNASRSVLANILQNSSIIHVHGLWEPHFLAASIGGLMCHKPLLVSPHGMLDAWALDQKRRKKALYSFLLQRPLLNRLTCLRALTIEEARDARRYGVEIPIAVIPNGIEAPALTTADEFLDSYPRLRGASIVTFLGRLHKKKGVDLLIKAWQTLAQSHPDAHLVIAGPEEDRTLQSLRSLVAQAALSDRVTFTGVLKGTMKWSLLAASTTFVLPSISEGFSVAILEALSAGVPVVISHECNLGAVANNDCGLVVNRSVPAITEAIDQMLSTKAPAMDLKRARASQFARDHYSWKKIAVKMQAVYCWLAGGPRPDFLMETL
jgi:glycosyltransferase involved in cell wall biosynthesis